MVSRVSTGRQAGDEDTLAQRRNFSVRLPEPLYEELEAASRRVGTSMNQLMGSAIAAYLERPDLAPAGVGQDINTQIARDAVRQGPEAIAALKGIAKHASNRGQVTLAAVLWAAAARLVAGTEGPERAADELAHTAHVANSNGRVELAVTLWEEALRLDPNNLEVVNRLGQVLHHLAQRHDDVDRYREAERHLARVTFVDNHAKLFHGWSALRIARADRDADLEERAVGEIEEALKSWAFGQRDGQDRRRWLRQVQRLGEVGHLQEATALVAFANRNAGWEAIPDSELATTS
jgi:tetratricopeptide (TPR) repeat protein